MIKKLKIKFIALAMIAVCVLLTVIVAGMNIINYNAVVSEADRTLKLLSQNKGSFPDMENKTGRLPHGMSPEAPYESRYFSVLLNDDGEVVYTETSKIVSVDSGTAKDYAQSAIRKSGSKGFVEKYRYVSYTDSSGTHIIFLDCGRKLDSFYTFLYASIGMALLGLIVVFFVIFFFAGKILRPVSESYEKQKRFITDAGHEIKTPLTIINANVDVLEMELGENNECLEDIQFQTKRLTSLTNDLVMLTRMEENDSMQMIDFPVSEIVEDTAMPFRTLAESQSKELILNIQPSLAMKGNGKAIIQLVSILIDNALKYSPCKSTIAVNMEQHSKNIILSVFNTTEEEIPKEALPHVFDRFYRTDASRNSETGGHGIGLSVAKAIVTAHNGRIQASSPDGYSFLITASFPM